MAVRLYDDVLSDLNKIAIDANDTTIAYKEVLTADENTDITLIDGRVVPSIAKRLKQYVVSEGGPVLTVNGENGHVEIPKDLLFFESVDDMKKYKFNRKSVNIYLYSFHNGKNKGGGIFKVDFEDITTKEDGGTIFISKDGVRIKRQNISNELYNVQWFGALGDSVTDDTLSIKQCIKSLGELDVWNNLSNPTDSSFCTIFFPASEGNYIITDTIYILPYMCLKGDSAYGGSLFQNSKRKSSIIETKFELAENYKWAISTLNRVRATGNLTTWDSNYSGNNYDNGIVTGCFGSAVENLVIMNTDTTKRVYGGIRMQNSPQCRVVGCYVSGFDVGVYSSGAWDSKFDFGSGTYKVGFLGYGDLNNAMIDGYHHGTKDGLAPMTQQHPQAILADSTAGFVHNQATAKYGVRINYAYGFTMRNIISEYHDVGIALSQSTGSINAAYVEKNTRAFAIVASNVHINSIAGVRNDYSFAFGTGSRVTLDQIVTDNALLGFNDTASMRYNCNVGVNKMINVQQKQGKPFYIKDSNNVIYVNATSGKDTNSGYISGYPVQTLAKALEIISFKPMQSGDTNVMTDVEETWTIALLTSDEYNLTAYRDIHNRNIILVSLGGSAATVSTGSFVPRLYNSSLMFKGVNYIRTNNNNSLTSNGGIICNGKCKVSFVDSNVTLTGNQSVVSVHPTVYADTDISIIGGTCLVATTGKFYTSTSNKAIASIYVRQAMATQIHTLPEKGVSTTTEGLKYPVTVLNV